MKFRLNNKYIRWGLTAFLVIVASICFYYLLFHGTNIKNGIKTSMNVLMPIVLGLALGYLMTPVLNSLEYRIFIPLCKQLKIKESTRRNHIIRAISIVLTILLFFTIIYSLISMLISQIVPSVSNIISNFDEYINNFIKWLNKLLSDDYPELGNNIVKVINEYSTEFEFWLNDTVLTKTSELIKTVSLSVIGILKLLWNILVGLMISVYVLASKEKFAGQAKKITYALFNSETANIIINNFRFTHRTFIGFLGGKILDSIIIGMLCFVGTSLMQTPYAALISVIVGVTNVIPVFGPYIGAIPCTILVLVVDPAHPLNSLYFAIFIFLLQQFDGNVLGPKILGDSTGLAGFWVIFSITLFGGLFGVMGMVVGVPVFAVIYAAIKAYVHALLKKKNIPLDTEKYTNVAAIKDGTLYEYVPEHKLKKKDKETVVFGTEFLYGFDGNDFVKYEQYKDMSQNSSTKDKSSNSVSVDNKKSGVKK